MYKKNIFRPLCFFMFILSGIASISYQLLWLRDAITYFGVISPVISAVISVFMMGLCGGNYFAGKLSSKISPLTAIRLYVAVEVLIGISAILVHHIFTFGYTTLLTIETQTSSSYLFYSWLVITISLLPACFLIGCTYPLVMRFLQNKGDKDNFSYLYMANLIGALSGSLLPLVIIEIYGFRHSVFITASFNFIAAAIAFFLSVRTTDTTSNIEPEEVPQQAQQGILSYGKATFILFITGYVSLSSEIIWIKLFTPDTGTAVYSFAMILALYLVTNLNGTRFYRDKSRPGKEKQLNIVLLAMPASALLPLIITKIGAIEIISMTPVCLCFGFLLPYVIDRTSNNNPEIAAKLYNYNFAGCILGPLVTSYILYIPFGLKAILILNAALLLAACTLILKNNKKLLYKCITLSVLFAIPAFLIGTPEDHITKNGVLTRDHIGYIGATGEGMGKGLTVNGVGMTTLTTITKNMAYLPLTYRPDTKSVLVICFGMGTTVRSYTTWPVEKITAAELSPGVINSFSYFHDDAARVLADPRVNIVNDDGRRFLNRTNQKFDIIALDPPPPVFASGSGLLYSKEMISLIKSRLTENGVLVHWIPKGDGLLISSVVNAIRINFKNVVVYKSIENWGYHILASDGELGEISAERFVATLPDKSKEDLREWMQDSSIEQIAEGSLHQVPVEQLISRGHENLVLSDDFLFNEFFLLRGLKLIFNEKP